MNTAEVADSNTANCASSGAGTWVITIRTFIIVDNSKIVDNLDSTAGADLFTSLATNTAIIALLSDSGTLFLIITGYKNHLNVIHKEDDTIWTSLYTKATACAFSCIYMGDIILNTDSIVGAYLCTVT